MDYNSNRKKMVMPEYGRNIQNMVDYVVSIEDRDERNRGARSIIDVMGNLNPFLRDVPDFKHKLWDHLAIMSDFKLDIDYPYDPPSPTILTSKPNKIPYSTGNIKYKHYGRVLDMMIKKTADYPEGPEKESLIQMIADHMKKCYLTWNKESVDDEKVMGDFHELSKGKIDVPEDFQLKDMKDLLYKPKKKQHSGKRTQGHKNDYRKN
ncbi:MAG: DUF4290 domain-containing protein [Prolixibacteraceae bacterium]|nr:DUF4290 domain-containing protein [Prolixibacteraceae bacterium]